jgi:hypothetical protein
MCSVYVKGRNMLLVGWQVALSVWACQDQVVMWEKSFGRWLRVAIFEELIAE